MQFFVKTIISALVIAGVSELAKRSTALAAILVSLPITSILAMIWVYRDSRDAQKVSSLSIQIFWAVLPSLVYFLTLPLLLKSGVAFPWAVVISCAVMFAAYSIYAALLARWGVTI
jgi:hypothetical protein